MLTLGLDAGGSATRWVLLDSARDTVVARGEAGPASGHIFDPAVRERTLSALAAIAAAVRPHGGPARIAGAVTGLGAGTPQAGELAAILERDLGTPSSAIALGDDLWIPALALFPRGDGGLVYAGTGSVAYGIRADGTAVKIGGYGVVIDDAGGAYWIACAGIRTVLRRRDEGLADGPLAGSLAALAGGGDWPSVRRCVYSRDRGGIAALAPFVAEAADDGDADALAILRDAGAELARLGHLLAARMPCRRLALTGGALRLHPLITEEAYTRWHGVYEAVVADVDVALEAARVAAKSRMPPV
ncbi:N-acetylglucosamine kinase [Alsobacter sp. R-9]